MVYRLHPSNPIPQPTSISALRTARAIKLYLSNATGLLLDGGLFLLNWKMPSFVVNVRGWFGSELIYLKRTLIHCFYWATSVFSSVLCGVKSVLADLVDGPVSHKDFRQSHGVNIHHIVRLAGDVWSLLREWKQAGAQWRKTTSPYTILPTFPYQQCKFCCLLPYFRSVPYIALHPKPVQMTPSVQWMKQEHQCYQVSFDTFLLSFTKQFENKLQAK